jgi:hypothetical protein
LGYHHNVQEGRHLAVAQEDQGNAAQDEAAVADRPDPLPVNPIGEMADRNLARYLPGRISGKTPNTFLALFD